jgi:hypothetical protein
MLSKAAKGRRYRGLTPLRLPANMVKGKSPRAPSNPGGALIAGIAVIFLTEGILMRGALHAQQNFICKAFAEQVERPYLEAQAVQGSI